MKVGDHIKQKHWKSWYKVLLIERPNVVAVQWEKRIERYPLAMEWEIRGENESTLSMAPNLPPPRVARPEAPTAGFEMLVSSHNVNEEICTAKDYTSLKKAVSDYVEGVELKSTAKLKDLRELLDRLGG